VANPQNLKPWKPGQSGNPAGSSKGRRATSELLKLIDEKGADRAIAVKWLNAILEGDFRYFKEFLDRIEGKVTQVVDVKSEGERRLLIPDADPRADKGRRAAKGGTPKPDPTE
jgi:hypothetical protein